MNKEKARLRAHYKQRRKEKMEVASYEVEQVLNQQLIELFERLELKNKHVGIYAPFNFEPKLEKALNYLQSQSATLLLPKIISSATREMQFYPLSESLVAHAFGMFEPRGEGSAIVPDIILVPALIIDENGYRLGYGGGYYDTYLNQHASEMERTIGICLWRVKCGIIPVASYDRAVNHIVYYEDDSTTAFLE